MSSPQPIRVFLASSNPGKLREYRVLAGDSPIELALLPNFTSIPEFEETAPTFAENSAGKAMHYSRFATGTVLADDSGLVVPALGGAPGVFSARYAGPGASDTDRLQKLLREMSALNGDDRKARFVCVTTLAQNGRAVAVLSDSVEGIIAKAPKGSDGFGYDPVFFFPQLGRTYAEITREEKNQYSHRGRAFRKALAFMLGRTI
ncbi:MAG TPA: RdgB/HAM1 family non-canonical purine NTP pyrophosphatase [Candidatus Acidoferrales bacterium]